MGAAGAANAAESLVLNARARVRTGAGTNDWAPRETAVQWDPARTAVVVVSEFGRTVAGNGTGGTDHGSGGVGLLLGGAVAGGRVLGQWPGLAQLRDGRDLRPSTDSRSLFKGLLPALMGVPEGLLEDRIFPGSRSTAPLEGLCRA